MIQGPLQGSDSAYVYDSRNRLIAAGGVQYTYDADNIRRSLTTSEGTTFYVTDTTSSLSQLLMETDEQGVIRAYYVYGMGLIGTVLYACPLLQYGDKAICKP
ncbi:hypothetical protein GCM10008018_18450 [Paenibacillus marchantiophytorum]|uniref:RHS repeat-associated core domain-containing protein n=2 Tax=Paenibacillus marchantiophytorum TaxID=1619310 RepID=A0ABQ2BSN8_9BACL|nr:hypothetical protein GCM10008018_18450 [Paenibacillus marchantiophytorum]